MLIYVAHAYDKPEDSERAKRITRELQLNDGANTYICPIMLFSHLQHEDIGFDEKVELCLDVLSICDKLVVASETSERVMRELEFAQLIKMEVTYYEESNG